MKKESKFKQVKVRNRTFKIIPEKKVVEGMMPGKNIDDILDCGIKRKYKDLISRAASNLTEDKYGYWYDVIGCPDDVKATAYCDDKDVYDEKIGIEICSSKLDWRQHLKLAKLYNRIAKDLQEAALIAQSFCIKHDEKAKAIEEDLCRMYGRLPL